MIWALLLAVPALVGVIAYLADKGLMADNDRDWPPQGHYKKKDDEL